MSIKNLVKGYRYTTSTVVRYGDWDDLNKLAKSENRKFRKQRRIDRCVVYPVPGTMSKVGQLCILR